MYAAEASLDWGQTRARPTGPARQSGRWPSRSQMEYAKVALELLLLLLALPWIVGRLLSDPAGLMRNLGRTHEK